MTSHMIVPVKASTPSLYPVVPRVWKGTMKSEKNHQVNRFNQMLYYDKSQSFSKIQEGKIIIDECSSFSSLPLQDKHSSEKKTITETLSNPPFPLPDSLTSHENVSVLSSDEFKQTANDSCVAYPPFIYEKILFNSVKYFPDLETAGAILWHSSNVYHRLLSLRKNDVLLHKKYFSSNPCICKRCNNHSTLRLNTSS